MGVSRANGEANGIYYETEVTAAVPPHTHLHKYTYTDTFAQIQYQIQIFSFFYFSRHFLWKFSFSSTNIEALEPIFQLAELQYPPPGHLQLVFILVNIRMLCLHLGSAYPHIVPISI